MIYEYAVEPKLIVQWAIDVKVGQYFIEKFGIGRARIICEYPEKDFHKQIYDELNTIEDDIEREKGIEFYNQLTETMIKRKDIVYNNTDSWLENVRREHKRFKFFGILAYSNPKNSEEIIDGINFEWNKIQRWNHKRGIVIHRKAADIADTVSEMLKNADSVLFIDPHFRADKSQWRDTYTLFLKILANRFHKSIPSQIEIHASADYQKAPSYIFFKDACEKYMKKCIPKDLTVTFKRWKQSANGPNLHNRYILTDLGGVLFGYGTDRGETDNEIDDLMLLDEEQYRRHCNNYLNQPLFDLDGPVFQIKGK